MSEPLVIIQTVNIKGLKNYSTAKTLEFSETLIYLGFSLDYDYKTGDVHAEKVIYPEIDSQ